MTIDDSSPADAGLRPPHRFPASGWATAGHASGERAARPTSGRQPPASGRRAAEAPTHQLAPPGAGTPAEPDPCAHTAPTGQ